MGGGIPEGHIVLISGNTGTGKTLFGLHFIAAGLEANESSVYLTIEESSKQLLHVAGQFGWDFAAAERNKRLAFVDVPFSGMRADQILYRLADAAREVGAKRLVMDSISALLSGGANQREVRLFLEQLVSFCKAEGMTAILTYSVSGAFGISAGELLGGSSVTEARLSSIVDSIILLNYLESVDHVNKLLSILKVRGSQHDHGIFNYDIVTGEGVVIGERFERRHWWQGRVTPGFTRPPAAH